MKLKKNISLTLPFNTFTEQSQAISLDGYAHYFPVELDLSFSKDTC